MLVQKKDVCYWLYVNNHDIFLFACSGSEGLSSQEDYYISQGIHLRTIHLPNAFIINYSERYNDDKGYGEFSLVLRQKADKIPDVETTEDGQ
jgi:hypothetical protein